MNAHQTTHPKPLEQVEKWYIVNAEGQVVGRLAARVAKLVRGKCSPSFLPSMNPRIHVVIVNAEKAVFTGKKWRDKIYYHHTGWRTGIRAASAQEVLEKDPSDILRKAIHGMLPKNRLGAVLDKNVRIFAGTEHPHGAQNPEPFAIKTRQPKARV